MAGTLDGKVALVTGAGRGIGRAVALKLASQGARLVVNDLDAEPVAEVVAEVERLGSRAVACPGSVSAPDFADRFVGAAVSAYGAIDVVVNNAGYTWDGVIQKMTDEQWYAILDCHLTAPFRILRAAQPVIRGLVKAEQEKGLRVMRKVVNVSSIAGLFGNAGQSNYAAAKAGVVGLTQTLAKEWGRLNVNVNCVAYGLIRTRLTSATADAGATARIEGRDIKLGVNPDLAAQMERAIPLGRAGTPEEAAGAVYLLCLPEADYVSGQVLLVSGGLTGI
jgi:3-oxoacyl-[acyl-carrier protein] reductase